MTDAAPRLRRALRRPLGATDLARATLRDEQERRGGEDKTYERPCERALDRLDAAKAELNGGRG